MYKHLQISLIYKYTHLQIYTHIYKYILTNDTHLQISHLQISLSTIYILHSLVTLLGTTVSLLCGIESTGNITNITDVERGYLSYRNLPVCSNQSCHSPLASHFHKAFPPADLPPETL